MAEDPRVKAHNEAVRLERIRAEEAAIKSRAAKSQSQTNAQINRAAEKGGGAGNTGCLLAVGILVSAPAVLAAFHWLA